jgi:hypothetical protein
MADPTLGLSFQDLILRVAEFLSVADYSGSTAAIPTDAHDLELCKRLVNDGYRRYTNANPNWTVLSPLNTITFQASYRGTAQSGTTTTITDTTLTQPTGVSFIGMTVGIVAGTGIGQSAVVSGWNSTTHVLTFGAMTIAPDSTSQYSIAGAACVNGDNSRYYMPDRFIGDVLTPWTYDSYGPRIRIEDDSRGPDSRAARRRSVQRDAEARRDPPGGYDRRQHGQALGGCLLPGPGRNLQRDVPNPHLPRRAGQPHRPAHLRPATRRGNHRVRDCRSGATAERHHRHLVAEGQRRNRPTGQGGLARDAQAARRLRRQERRTASGTGSARATTTRSTPTTACLCNAATGGMEQRGRGDYARSLCCGDGLARGQARPKRR